VTAGVPHRVTDRVVAGVDGCRGGWVAVRLAGDPPAFAGALAAAGFAELLARLGDAAVVAIDIPLGLAEAGWRAADTLARAALGRAGASVFLIPPRPALEAATHAEASALCSAQLGQGCSIQAWGLRRRIFEVEAARLAAPAGGPRLVEAHPELCLATMAGAPLAWSKKTARGHELRRALLAGQGIQLPAGPVEPGAKGVRVAPDDLADAAAAAWTAARVAAGRAEPLPDPPAAGADRHGWPIAIWR